MIREVFCTKCGHETNPFSHYLGRDGTIYKCSNCKAEYTLIQTLVRIRSPKRFTIREIIDDETYDEYEKTQIDNFIIPIEEIKEGSLSNDQKKKIRIVKTVIAYYDIESTNISLEKIFAKGNIYEPEKGYIQVL